MRGENVEGYGEFKSDAGLYEAGNGKSREDMTKHRMAFWKVPQHEDQGTRFPYCTISFLYITCSTPQSVSALGKRMELKRFNHARNLKSQNAMLPFMSRHSANEGPFTPLDPSHLSPIPHYPLP